VPAAASDATTATPASPDAGGPPGGPASSPDANDATATVPAPPFALVAIGELELYRLTAGGVLGADPEGSFFSFGGDGTVRPLASLSAAVRAPWVGAVGTIGGSWPGSLLVERYRIAPADSTTGQQIEGDAAGARVTRTTTGSYLLPPCAWRNGALLALRAEGPSSRFSRPLDRTGRLEVLGRSAERPPSLPPEALFDDAFVAYPSGRIFVLGGRRSRPIVEHDASEYEQERGYLVDGAMVWQSDAGGARLEAVQLPGTTARDRLRGGLLLAGTSEADTLAWGTLEVWKDRVSHDEPYLARFTGAGWQRLPRVQRLRQLSRGGDGTVWAVAASDDREPPERSWLERVTFAPDGALVFARAVAPFNRDWLKLGDAATSLRGCASELHPRQIAVVAQDDIWLTAHCVGSGGERTTLLLHTGQQRPLVSLTSSAPAAP
jgi:hypothetical protein